MIDRDTIDRIMATADIIDVLSEFITLKQAGANYRGLSPFTNEKTPSFMVSPSKGIYKCFSSGKGGNVVTFLMEHEKISYPEALRYLAKKYNIEIQEKELTAEDVQQRNKRESLLATVEFAAKQFIEWLWDRDEGKAIGLSYFKERGMNHATIKKFQLGYSLEGRDAFTKLAIDKGYKLEYLLETGLSKKKEDSNNPFDGFIGRVIFPIHGISGQVIGFGGRSLRKDAKAKYLNSPASDIYNKSNVLYGLYFAKKSITTEEKCYLVEGYTDVISMHQSGIENVVASSGTALTKEQIRLLKRFTKNITVIYDGDKAGIKAALRGIDLILEEGLNTKVLLLPEGEDPDSFARSRSASEFKQFILENETDFISFKTKLLIDEAKDDPIQRATLIKDIVKSIAAIPDGITRSVYLRECSKMLDIGEDILYTEIQKILRNKIEDYSKRVGKEQYKSEQYRSDPAGQEKAGQGAVKTIQADEHKHEKDLIQLILIHGNKKVLNEKNEEVKVFDIILEELGDEIQFQHPLCKTIYNDIVSYYNDFGTIDDKSFTMNEESAISSFAVDLLTSNYQLSKIWDEAEKVFDNTSNAKLGSAIPTIITGFKNKQVQRMLKSTQEELALAQQNNNDENVDHCMRKYMILLELHKQISKELGERVIIR